METIITSITTTITTEIMPDLLIIVTAMIGISLLLVGYRLIRNLLGFNSMDDNGFYISSREWDNMTEGEQQEYIDDMRA